MVIKSILALSFFAVNAFAASSISQCPPLAPRTTPAADVTDLRIDDIKIVGALGDR